MYKYKSNYTFIGNWIGTYLYKYTNNYTIIRMQRGVILLY